MEVTLQIILEMIWENFEQIIQLLQEQEKIPVKYLIGEKGLDGSKLTTNKYSFGKVNYKSAIFNIYSEGKGKLCLLKQQVKWDFLDSTE